MEELIRVSFPGLGIGEFEINKVAFPLFAGIEVRWYGIIITCAILVGFLYAHFRSKHEGISTDDLLDYAIYTVIFAIIGARAYYVLSEPDRFDSFYDTAILFKQRRSCVFIHLYFLKYDISLSRGQAFMKTQIGQS